jgi:hypothetical protein
MSTGTEHNTTRVAVHLADSHRGRNRIEACAVLSDALSAAIDHGVAFGGGGVWGGRGLVSGLSGRELAPNEMHQAAVRRRQRRRTPRFPREPLIVACMRIDRGDIYTHYHHSQSSLSSRYR